MRMLLEADARLLQETVDRVQTALQGRPGRGYAPLWPDQAPDIHVAFAGSGIAGMSGLVPSSAACDIYRITASGLAKAFSRPQRVYSVWPDPLPAGSWAVVMRSKYGHWLVIASSGLDEFGTGTGTGTTDCLDPGCLILPTEPPDEPQTGNVYVTSNTLFIWNGTTWVSISLGGGGTAAGGCAIVGLHVDDCIEATSGVQSVRLEYDSVELAWLSVESLDYPGGSGVVRFWYEALDGRIHLSVDGKELLWCGDCFVGGPLTGHFPAGTGTAVAPCEGETFEVCLECVECPGTGTGTGGSIQTSCCDDPIPATLPVVAHPISNACPCVEGANFDLVYDAVEDEWYGSTTVCDDKLLEIVLWCDGNGINVIATCDGQSTDTANGTNPPLIWTPSCGPPFEVEVGWTAFSGDSCCSSEASEHPVFVIGG